MKHESKFTLYFCIIIAIIFWFLPTDNYQFMLLQITFTILAGMAIGELIYIKKHNND